MMQGYDKAEALAYITMKLTATAPEELKEDLELLVDRLIDADMAYMHQANVLDAEGNAGDSYYDDDDAIEFMVDQVSAQMQYTPEMTIKLALLTDDYMDFQQEYLEKKGLIAWE